VHDARARTTEGVCTRRSAAQGSRRPSSTPARGITRRAPVSRAEADGRAGGRSCREQKKDVRGPVGRAADALLRLQPRVALAPHDAPRAPEPQREVVRLLHRGLVVVPARPRQAAAKAWLSVARQALTEHSRGVSRAKRSGSAAEDKRPSTADDVPCRVVSCVCVVWCGVVWCRVVPGVSCGHACVVRACVSCRAGMRVCRAGMCVCRVVSCESCESCACVVSCHVVAWRADMCGRSVGGGSVDPYTTVRHSVRAAVRKGSVWVRQKEVVVDPVGQYR
jgi:hypothetical protein